VNAAFPSDSDDVRTWLGCAQLLSHALAAAAHAKKLDLAPDEAGCLLNQVGLYLRERAEFGEAKAAHERALKIGEAAYGANHPRVAIDVNNLGSVLKAQGDPTGAKANGQRALKMLRGFLGEDHPKTVMVRKNLESLGTGIVE
jgi:Tfp pilus assembly protein PilF